MKSSRALLLTALMTVTAPVFMFASEGNPNPNQTQQNSTNSSAQTNPTTEPGILSKIGSGTWNAITWPFITALITAPDFIAQNSLHKIADMGWLKDGKIASALRNEWVGRVSVYVAAAYLAMKINEIYKQTQNDTADEQQLLFEDENNF